MGCGSSTLSPAHRVCRDAFYGKKDFDLGKLMQGVEGLTTEQLAQKDSVGMSALDILASCTHATNRMEAAAILLGAGADPFNEKDVYTDTAFSFCVKAGNLEVLTAFVRTLDAEGWYRFTDMLATPIACDRNSAINTGVWVQVAGKKGRTELQPELQGTGDDRWGMPATVRFEDGSVEIIAPEKMTILPQAPKGVLELLHNLATDCPLPMEKEMVLERINSLEISDRLPGET
mmetsp:Transcript_20144/g.40871  ORF Transcript_20144/g.40871 Transcript_20144/m.40871 type:complete len:232 (+) Transcript_20144:119-814(+)